jgi:hypothetical protein
MVVSFMIAIPLPGRRPLVGGLTPATNAICPIRQRLPDFFEDLSGAELLRSSIIWRMHIWKVSHTGMIDVGIRLAQ